MSPVPSYRAKRDANEREIIDALESEGCAVQQLSAPGVPDLLCWIPDAESFELVEVKMPGKTLTPTQEHWWNAWTAKGGRCPWILSSASEARHWLRVLRAHSDLDTPASAIREAK